MDRQALGKVTRTRSVAKDLTAEKTIEIRGGIVTNNKDDSGAYRYAAPTAGFFRSASGLDSETE